ncbi:MAG: hypothetical protein A3E54_04030 [Gammaproteobacteria bacterium RIFCSPHIGHO2_12_FULL_41_25]|nr:MAG: hypothetical protein A3B71_02530 [Gammaproteobacteria bacterium RIFCSPHIGHO2_02_FULL_42_43]OGT28884.1 MAG: hypothetical protein A2624_06905 [Gammaproteobacteria bacterium RIFCSPHIGHO2_01_FULL_42_8]OGT51951.1 MAG: hypothetical protein A3E54_04030 [Gammaproteobacteria bacterium RIFCSPHIGHO2_12_FULL_41_25]OGT86983.1 MAG: hypothetical protein A3G86_00410 [Gammaproteobacteria bacterium RIFCSPLOWO2_12_FULL_42_18]
MAAMLTIAYDPSIPYAEEFFSSLGVLKKIDPRTVRSHDLKDADVLLIRSTLLVNSALLSGTAVKVICTASAGLNHIQLDEIQSAQFAIFHGKGANALAVADYVLAAFFETRQYQNIVQPTIGIVGLGNIGSQVYRRLLSLGFSCVGCDPLISDTSNYHMKNFHDVLNCDVITFHVPLTTTGSHPTFHLLNQEMIHRVRAGSVVINTSRGEVIDTQYVLERMRVKNDLTLVFDVWENEPDINRELVERCHLSTPHIAGWSDTAKKNIVFQLYQQTAQFFHLNTRIDVLKNSRIQKNFLESAEKIPFFLSTLLRECIDLKKLSNDFKQSLMQHQGDVAAVFQQLRNNYRNRPELSDYCVTTYSEKVAAVFKTFQIKSNT